MLFARSLRVPSALLVVSVCSVAAYADSPASVQKAIQAAYNKSDAAVGKKDITGLTANSAPDYALVLKNGQKITLDQLRPQMAQMFKLSKSMSAKTVIQKVQVKGKEAEVTAKSHNELVLLNPQTQKLTQYVMDSTIQDTWVKSAKGWLKKQTKPLTQTTKIDGKVAPSM